MDQAWVHMQTFLRANLLTAQLASGGPEAGQPVGSAGEAITHFRDDIEDATMFIDGLVDVSGASCSPCWRPSCWAASTRARPPSC